MQNSDFGALFGQLKRLFTPANGGKTEAAAQKPVDFPPSAPSPQGDPGKENAAGTKLSGAGSAAPTAPAEPFTVKAEAFFMGHDRISRRIDERAKQAAADELPKTTIIEAKPSAKAPAPANEAKRLQNAAAELLTAARVQKPDAETTRVQNPDAKITAAARLQNAAESTATAARGQNAAAESVTAGKPENAQTAKPASQPAKPTAQPAKRTETQTEKRAKSAPAYFALPLFPPSFPEESPGQDDAANPQKEE